MRAYLVAEGPQDVAFLSRLLELSGFEQYVLLPQLEAEQPGWSRLVPRAFPVTDKLVEPLIVPSFFRANDGFVCLQSAGGYDRLSSSVEKMLATVPAGEIDAIAQEVTPCAECKPGYCAGWRDRRNRGFSGR